LAAFYSSTGRPSIDPELMIRMLIVGYCFAIRSQTAIRQTEVSATKRFVEAPASIVPIRKS
jgi:transposase